MNIHSPIKTRRRAAGLTMALGLSLTAGTLAAIPASALVINDPPANGRAIVVFPDRDFINGQGWPADAQLTVQLFRGGLLAGTANVTPQDDPSTPGFDGFFDLNHAGGDPCWNGATPDVRLGDVVRVVDQNDVAHQTRVAGVHVTQAATHIGGGTVVWKGFARTPAGAQLPTSQLEARIIAPGALFDVNGRRSLRVVPVYDSATALTWTATVRGLNQHDVDLAVGGESRVMWLGRNPAAENELTIAEELGFDGISAAPGCPAPVKGPSVPDLTPATDTGFSMVDNLTRLSRPTFRGLAGDAPAGATIKLYVDNRVNGTGTVSSSGTWAIQPATELSHGTHTVAAAEINPATGLESRSKIMGVRIDRIRPVARLTSMPPSPTRDSTPTFGFTTGERNSSYQCSLGLTTLTSPRYFACRNPKTYAAQAPGVYAFRLKSFDAAGNAGYIVTYRFRIIR